MSTSLVHRLAAAAGVAGAAVLLVNTAKRAGILPANAVTQLVAPLAQVMALMLVLALFARVGSRAGHFGLIAFVLNVTALTLLVGVEFVLNLVFPRLDSATVTDLRAGPLGVMLVIASMTFLAGTVLFAASLWRTGGPPRPALVLYVAGAVPVALRAAVPEAALQLGLLALAVAVGWLSVWLWSDATQDARTTAGLERV
ncbi:MAG: hypothetical protein ACRDP9_04685 [Kribbellaceae bacterium]